MTKWARIRKRKERKRAEEELRRSEAERIEVKPTEVEAGSGSLPLEKLPSAALQFNGKVKTSELSRRFRTAEKAVLGYVTGNKFYIDLKAIPPSQEIQLLETLNNVLL